ncbi:hypothetical protein [Alkalihalobacillus sp. 1P02AB]|uniref:hypothetical protein n=1 Tax=Alkalihalobacillus sp. 1P02AB TaxID=3132260 RepID=UPI0039A5402B
MEFTLAALTGNVDYVIELVAEDLSGNVSEKSEPITIRTSHQIIKQEERFEHPRSPEYDYLWDISEDGPVIPGLSEGLIPQGLSYYEEENWLLSVYYLDDKRPSTLTVVDAATEQLVKSIVLYNVDGTPYTGHAGGVAVSEDHVWIASEQSLFQLRLSDLLAAGDNEELQFIDEIPVPVQAAYNVYSDGVLWVGEFYEANDYPTNPEHHLINRDDETYFSWMVGFTLDETTDSFKNEQWSGEAGKTAHPDFIISTREKVQGVVFVEDQIILSTSYGRANDSYFYRYYSPLQEEPHMTVMLKEQEVPVWFLDSKQEPETNSLLRIIPMSEGIINVGTSLYATFESGANKYRFTTSYIMDRMLKIDLTKWAELDNPEAVKPPEEEPPAESEGPEWETEEPPRESEGPLEEVDEKAGEKEGVSEDDNEREEEELIGDGNDTEGEKEIVNDENSPSNNNRYPGSSPDVLERELPFTATRMYTWVLFGGVLLICGMFVHLISRKRYIM